MFQQIGDDFAWTKQRVEGWGTEREVREGVREGGAEGGKRVREGG